MLANKDASSLWRVNPSCKTARNCVEIHNMNLQRNWGGRTQSRQSRSAFTSLGMKADLKCETTDLLQSRQKGSAEAELPIFGNEGSVSGEADLQIFGSQDWAKVQKRNFKSLEVQTEMKCGSGTSHLWKSWQNKCGKRNFRSLPVKAERKCGSRTSHIWQSRQSRSAEAELHILGSQCRTKVRMWNFRSLAVKTEQKRNFRSLAVKAEPKCGSGTSGLCHQGRAEVWTRNFRSLAVKTERKCENSTADLLQSSHDGRAEADLNIFDRPISYWLSLPVLKNNSTDCYIEGQCEDHVWLKHMTFAMRVTSQYNPARALDNTGLNPFLGPFCRVKKSPSSRRIGPLGSFVPAVFGRDVCLMSWSLSHVSWFDHA